MDEMKKRIKQKMGSENRRGGFPWWGWAIVLAGGLSALVGWLLRRRAAQEQPVLLEARPSPRLFIAETPVESIAPVVQEIPLPVQRTSWPAGQGEQAVAANTQAPASSSPASPAVQAGLADDLTVLEGIGPVIANVLRQAGINTYAQLAETDVTRLQEILRSANLRLGDPTTWPEQAKLLAAGDWDSFHTLTDQLKGGRRGS